MPTAGAVANAIAKVIGTRVRQLPMTPERVWARPRRRRRVTRRELVAAATVDEAVEAMAAGARPVAGGTDLVVGARQGKAPLPEASSRSTGSRSCAASTRSTAALRLGALVTHEEIAAHHVVARGFTALADASAIVGSHATRAQGTIGGNVMNASPAMETGGPLICFEATVMLRSAAGTRWVAVADLFTGPGSTVAEPDELLVARRRPGAGRRAPAAATSARVPTSDGDRRRRRHRRRHARWRRSIADARVAITALAPTIRRVPEAEAALVGSAARRGRRCRPPRAAAARRCPISDVRASERYRRAMAAVIARRAIEAAVARARGGDVPIPASPALHGGPA